MLALVVKLSEAFADELDPLIVEVRNKVADLREAEVVQIEEARAEKEDPEKGLDLTRIPFQSEFQIDYSTNCFESDSHLTSVKTVGIFLMAIPACTMMHVGHSWTVSCSMTQILES